MRRITLGSLHVWATGGDDRRGGGDGPAVVLCHGFGASGDDLAPLARVVDAGRGVRWFFPEAPGEADLGGGMTSPDARAWWPIDMARLQRLQERGAHRDLAGETPAGMDAAREALEATLAVLEAEHGVTPERTVLGGFSQGAMLATEIALHAARPFAGLAALSGALISSERWAAAAARSGPGLHAVVTHGQRDPILPFDAGRALAELLATAGGRVRFVPHGGGHEIPPSALDALAVLARERLTSPAGV